jgi:hypothetical protein
MSPHQFVFFWFFSLQTGRAVKMDAGRRTVFLVDVAGNSIADPVFRRSVELRLSLCLYDMRSFSYFPMLRG